jgi:hypothetical protein
MKLISRVIELSDTVAERSLPEFIAIRRMPGERYCTWDEITIDLHKLTDQVITDVTLKRFAERYGIPGHTRKDGAGEVTTAEYTKAIRKAGIKI